MPKSQITIDAVTGDIPIDVLLRHLQVLAHDIHNSELEQWAEKELTGYNSDDNVPDYRKTKSLNITYSGISNYVLKVKNLPISPGYLSADTLDTVSSIEIKEDVTQVQKFSEQEPGTYRDLSFLAAEVLKNTEQRVQCTSIQQLIPSSVYSKVIAEVRNKLIKALLLLEDQYGNLDSMSIDVRASRAASSNEQINDAVFRDKPIENAQQTLWERFTSNWVAPTITGIIGTILSTMLARYFGLG